MPNAVIQIGSICLIKVDGAVTVRNLTEPEIAHVASNPALFADPAAALHEFQPVQEDAAARRGAEYDVEARRDRAENRLAEHVQGDRAGTGKARQQIREIKERIAADTNDLVRDSGMPGVTG